MSTRQHIIALVAATIIVFIASTTVASAQGRSTNQAAIEALKKAVAALEAEVEAQPPAVPTTAPRLPGIYLDCGRVNKFTSTKLLLPDGTELAATIIDWKDDGRPDTTAIGNFNRPQRNGWVYGFWFKDAVGQGGIFSRNFAGTGNDILPGVGCPGTEKK